jgi:hypothetical protein
MFVNMSQEFVKCICVGGVFSAGLYCCPKKCNIQRVENKFLIAGEALKFGKFDERRNNKHRSPHSAQLHYVISSGFEEKSRRPSLIVGGAECRA